MTPARAAVAAMVAVAIAAFTCAAPAAAQVYPSRPITIIVPFAAGGPTDVLSRVLSDLRMDHRRAEVEIVKVWNSLIDPNIVAHAQPVGLRKGTLFVNVDSNVWLSEIVRYRRKEILDRLQHSFGKNLIQKISFRVG